MTKVLLEINDEIWEKFKSITTKEKTLNEAVTEIIKEKIESNNK